MKGRLRHARARRHAGAASTELLLGALVVIPLVCAIIEFAQLAVARHALNHAAMEAARAGAVSGGNRREMRLVLARSMLPLFARVPRAGDSVEGAAAAGLVAAMAEFLRADLADLAVLSPTPAAFSDFGVWRDGERVIPNEGLGLPSAVGAASGRTLREANVLALQVRYCRALLFPWHATLLPAGLTGAAFDTGCRLRGRWPIQSIAAVQMQSPARRSLASD